MSSMIGNTVRASIFGGSHTEAIGVVLDGLPHGEEIDLTALEQQMARRAPGRDKSSTPRKESDTPRILCGLLDGVTTGAPLCLIIENTNTRSKDYSDLKIHPRPGHADYTAYVRYGGHNDIRGGGHFSGRLTACLTAAGAIARQILENGAFISALMLCRSVPYKIAGLTPFTCGTKTLCAYPPAIFRFWTRKRKPLCAR